MWTTDGPQTLEKSVATIEQFLLKHPSGEQILAIGAGPFRVNFYPMVCANCGNENLVRQYCAKTLAIVKFEDHETGDDGRSALAAMDTIALALAFHASTLWITPDKRGEFIGLGLLYMPFAQWVSQSNAIVARRINELSASGDVLPPVATFMAGQDASWRKCLRAVCRHCNTSLSISISDSCGPIRFSFTLQGQDGEKVMLPWPLAVGGLSVVDLIG